MIKDIGKMLVAHGLPVPNGSLLKILEWSLLRKTLLSLGVNCVLDVGANRGQFATNLRKIGYRGYIVSFEPIQKDFSTLAAHFSNDRFWRGYNLALGNEQGVRTFNVAAESSEMSSFLSPVDPNWALRSERVEIKKLDDIFQEIVEALPEARRIFLKMDTQGYDLEVVKGAAQSLQAIIGLQSELAIIPIYKSMPSYLEALAFYEHLGFSLIGLSEAASSNTGCLQEMNCLMARGGSLARR